MVPLPHRIYMQPGLCTRHCHIEQTSFFLHILVQHRAAVRRDTFIGIENIDNGKFQPLGTVHRRERDRVRLRPPLRRLPEQFLLVCLDVCKPLVKGLETRRTFF